MKIYKYLWGGSPAEEWSSQWKDRLQPSARSKVLLKWNASGKRPKPESSLEYTKRRVKEETKRTWMSDAADIAHGIREEVLALHPYTAIPYFGAKVGLDILNGNVNWGTALNLSVPLFHFTPQAVGLKSPTFLVPTKSTVFNPYIIDFNGKMHINWNDNLIQHKYGGKIK